MHWHAIVVKPQHEKTVDRQLRHLGFDSFLPLYRSRRRWSDRIKELQLPLFNGYVFCRFLFPERVKLLNVPGIRSVLTLGSCPAPIPDAEIEAVQKMIASGLPVRPWPFLKVGKRVRVERGALQGVEGILVQFKKTWRVVVGIELLQRSVTAELDLADVVPLDKHR